MDRHICCVQEYEFKSSNDGESIACVAWNSFDVQQNALLLLSTSIDSDDAASRKFPTQIEYETFDCTLRMFKCSTLISFSDETSHCNYSQWANRWLYSFLAVYFDNKKTLWYDPMIFVNHQTKTTYSASKGDENKKEITLNSCLYADSMRMNSKHIPKMSDKDTSAEWNVIFLQDYYLSCHTELHDSLLKEIECRKHIYMQILLD